MTIAVVDYGIGNLRSAEKALQHLGADARLTADAGRDRPAPTAVVLPGVGNFGACMRALRDERPRGGRRARRPPTAGRSSGSASACRCCSTAATSRPASPGSASSPAASRACRDRCACRRWAGTRSSAARARGSSRACPIPRGATSCTRSRPSPPTTPIVAAWCDYGRRFAAAVERGPLWATQFHPEKSGERRPGAARQLRASRGGLTMDLYPAIDLRGGRVVRLQQGDYDRETRLRRRPGRGRAPASTARARAGSTSSISTRRATAATRTSR